jgi:hypothetical protein
MSTNKAGRPAYTPTDKDRATVKAMAGYGVPQPEIARVIGVAEKTLRKHFRDELDLAAIQANAQVAQSIFQRAVNLEAGQAGITAAIFWMKARAGWRDRVQIDANVSVRRSIGEYSEDELAIIAGEAGRKGGTGEPEDGAE